MSNHLVIGARRTKSGFPLLIGEPQAGYSSPQILMDYELHSPTIDARGAGFPGLSAIVVMGRTERYSWSPTAGGADMIDTYVEKLCDPEGGHARRGLAVLRVQGRVPADGPAHAAPGASRGAVPGRRRRAHRARPGALARDAEGQAIAVVNKRSTYSKELDAAVSILRMNRGEATTANKFISIFGRRTTSRRTGAMDRAARSATCTAASTPCGPSARTRTSRSGAQASGSGRRTRTARTCTSAAPRCRTRRTRSAATRSRGTTARRPAGRRPTASGVTARSTAASCSRTRSSRRNRTRSPPSGSCR